MNILSVYSCNSHGNALFWSCRLEGRYEFKRNGTSIRASKLCSSRAYARANDRRGESGRHPQWITVVQEGAIGLFGAFLAEVSKGSRCKADWHQGRAAVWIEHKDHLSLRDPGWGSIAGVQRRPTAPETRLVGRVRRSCAPLPAGLRRGVPRLADRG